MLIVILVSALRKFFPLRRENLSSQRSLDNYILNNYPFLVHNLFWIKNYIIFTVMPRRDGRPKVRFRLERSWKIFLKLPLDQKRGLGIPLKNPRYALMAELADAIGSNPIIRTDGESSSLSRSTSHSFNVGSVKQCNVYGCCGGGVATIVNKYRLLVSLLIF